MDHLPQEILVYHILRYLVQRDVVCGVARVSRSLCSLIRGRYGVTINLHPFETRRTRSELGLMNIEVVRCCPTEWGRRGVGFEDFVRGLERWNNEERGATGGGSEGCCFTLMSVQKRLNAFPFFFNCLSSQFEFPQLQILPLRRLELSGIVVEASDLLVIQSITTLVDLGFDGCECGFDVFPPNLKNLLVTNSADSKEVIQIKNLPRMLQSLSVDKFSASCTNGSRSLFPPNLLHLNISQMILDTSPDPETETEADGYERLPFDFPSDLKTLKISSLPKLDILPSLSGLNELESLELHRCSSLDMSLFPFSSLRKLILSECDKIENVEFPSNLEELECKICERLQLSLTSLPQHLKKLRLFCCEKLEKARDITFPLHLKELHLGGFDGLKILPDLPQNLQSLTLTECDNLKSLPMFPESLRRVYLSLPNLEDLPSFPEGLEVLELHKCRELKLLSRIPSNLKVLKIEGGNFSSLKNLCLPDALIELSVQDSSEAIFYLTQFPKCLEQLFLRNIPGIDSLPPFPAALMTVKLVNLEGLKSLPLLPESLKDFTLQGCDSIRGLPRLPSNLRTLEIAECNQIKFIGMESESLRFEGKLPLSLRTLYLRSCRKLQAIGELPPKLNSIQLDKLSGKLLLHSAIPANLKDISILHTKQ